MCGKLKTTENTDCLKVDSIIMSLDLFLNTIEKVDCRSLETLFTQLTIGLFKHWDVKLMLFQTQFKK